ncbi:hypothetical protein [Peptoniphilus sp.]|uniref:hypothetical protein n=1 Tax=Peptoniphilus sp. TaxID=1971214 RepID=UPI003994E9EF
MNEIIIYDDSYGSIEIVDRLGEEFKKEKFICFCDDLAYPLAMRRSSEEIINSRQEEFTKMDPKIIAYPNIGKILVYPKSENRESRLNLDEYKDMTVLGNSRNYYGFKDYVDAQLLINQAKVKNEYTLKELIKEYLVGASEEVFLNNTSLCLFRKYFEELKGSRKIYYLNDCFYSKITEVIKDNEWIIKFPGKVNYYVTEDKMNFAEKYEEITNKKIYPSLYK